MVEESKIKKEFRSFFLQKMKAEAIMPFFYEIFTIGTAYVVGGFFRDFLNNQPSRDIDIIVDINNSLLLKIVESTSNTYTFNRQGGIKIKLNNLDLDIWSIENNWAFKNNLVKLNENDKLTSIAKGCFYNFDSLVINLHNFSYSLKYYKDFLRENQLNILQANSIYKNLNPSTEANILRAFYLKLKYNSTFSDSTYSYLYNKLGYIQDRYDDLINRLLEVKSKYPKYICLEEGIIEKYIKDVRTNFHPNNQILFDF